jgi:hypothetical protein
MAAETFKLVTPSMRSETVLTRAVVNDVPVGATVIVRCRGGGCPFKSKTIRHRHGQVKLTRAFRHRRLRPGTVVEVRITAPGRIGKVSRLIIRRAKAPRAPRPLCLPPGATRPERCA